LKRESLRTNDYWLITAIPVSIRESLSEALGKCINVYIWCAIGAFAGWLATRMMNAPARSAQIENILIGMFGAFIGGEFVSAQVSGAAVATGFHMSSLALAIAGAVVMLLLLRLMRKVVGPMQKGRSNQKKRDY
jgi:uncharacterized membrane protein YeaQ/YmgE (transglycosylase-associated protein family)